MGFKLEGWFDKWSSKKKKIEDQLDSSECFDKIIKNII